MITPGGLLIITFCMVAFMLALLVFMLIAMLLKNRKERQKEKWVVEANSFITQAIFLEDDEDAERDLLNRRVKGMLQEPVFRQLVTDGLVTSATNLMGMVSDNLGKLYKQLNLHKDSEKNLKSFHWHKKAKAIKELATMQLTEYSSDLYKLTNHKNEFIRMEAQTSIVKLHGFKGLTFLNAITYPISEWHQINLLRELSHVSSSEFQGIENWLGSANDTVIIFALKLSSAYHQFQLYDKIVECLKHSNPKVRLQAIKCLQQIYEDTTADHLIAIYQNEPKALQLAILNALQEIASAESITFLSGQLLAPDNAIKLAAARALSNCGEDGEAALNTHPAALEYPLKEIIQQIKMEVAA
jgi:hypothetical protein